MLTETAHRTLVLAATDTFSWPNLGSRPTSEIRAGLMAYLLDYANNTCAFCGETLAEGWEVCHVVSGGPDRRGWVPGNLAAGCLDCNDVDAMTGAVVPFASILRPDLVPTEWPANDEFRRMGREAKARRVARREAKAAKRGL